MFSSEPCATSTRVMSSAGPVWQEASERPESASNARASARAAPTRQALWLKSMVADPLIRWLRGPPLKSAARMAAGQRKRRVAPPPRLVHLLTERDEK